MPDPIDLLAPPAAELEPATRRRVLDATLRELRGQRRNSRDRATAALAAAMAAGLLLFALIPPAPQAKRSDSIVEQPIVAPPTPAVVLEWRAIESEQPEKAKDLYRQAGERYLEEGNYAGAVRSYGGSLDEGTAEDLEASPEDDYLLMALKLARKKESER